MLGRSLRVRSMGFTAFVVSLLLALPPGGGAIAGAVTPPAEGDPWPSCAGPSDQYCVQDFTISGVTPAEADRWVFSRYTLNNGSATEPSSFNWYFNYWDESLGDWGIPPADQIPYFTVRLNSGGIRPLYTTGYGDNVNIVTGGNATDGYTLAAEGTPIPIYWDSDTSVHNCYAGDCGGSSRAADISDWHFGANSQDMATWGAEARRRFGGMWIMSDAQYNDFPQFSRDPSPHWSITLGNPHLQTDGVTPVVGTFTARLPGGLLDDSGTTADEAVAAGLLIRRADGSDITTVGAAMMRSIDYGGIGSSVPDESVYMRIPSVHYSSPTFTVYGRSGASAFTAPDPPRYLRATPLDGAAVVRFEPPYFNGGAPIDRYSVTCTYTPESSENVDSVTRTAGGPVAIQLPLPNGIQSRCTGRATNDAGRTSDRSAAVYVTPQAETADIAPGAPARVGGTFQSGGDLQLTWSAPASKGGAPEILGYGVRVCGPSGDCWNAPLVGINMGPGARSATLDSLGGGKRLLVEVAARTAKGYGPPTRTWTPPPIITGPGLSTETSTSPTFNLDWEIPGGVEYPAGRTFTVWQSRNGGAWVAAATGLTGTKMKVEGDPGSTYDFRVAAVDRNGSVSALRPPEETTVPFDDRAMNYDGDWGTPDASNRYRGATHRTNDPGATATMTARGTAIGLIGDRGPNYGRFEVRVDDGAWHTADAQAPDLRVRKVLWAKDGLGGGEHTIRVRNLATDGRPLLAIDAVAFVR